MLPWLSALASGIWGWIQSHPVSWVERHPVWSAVTAFVIAFGRKVWAKLEPKLVDFVAESLEHRVAMAITGYGRLYAKHLLSTEKAPIRATPVLLFLREHAAAIGANADVRVTDLIDASLRDLPPPKSWFQTRLGRGKCLIMLDGLDEVADPGLRYKVVRWVERQVESLGANRFLVSSRPPRLGPGFRGLCTELALCR